MSCSHWACSAVRRLATAAALAGMLAACAADRVVTGSAEVLDYRQRHPIILTEAARSLDVFVIGEVGLDLRQREDVLAFAAEYRRNGQGGILAQVPAGTGNDRAARSTMAAISETLTEAGLPAGLVAATVYPVTDPLLASPIRLTFTRLSAEVSSACGTWPTDLGISDFRHGTRNESYWNLGCAMQSNVAAQVADPVDLVRGRTETPPDPIRRGKVIDAVRQGRDPSTQYRTSGGTINGAVGN